MRILAIFTGLLLPFAANAHRLDQHSDQSLIDELGYRGYYCSSEGPIDNPSVLAISCDQNTNMILSVYDSSAVKQSEIKYFMGSNSRCATERTRILAKTEKGRYSKDKVVAFCDQNTNLIKLRLTATQVEETERAFQGSESRCKDEADQFNSLFP